MSRLNIILGSSNTRKSSCIRALGGFSRSGQVFDVKLVNGSVEKVFCQISSLQEKKISPQQFIQLISRYTNCDTFLFPLWIYQGNGFPDFNIYLQAFRQANFTINQIVVLGQNQVNLSSSINIQNPIYYIPNSQSQPTNRTANIISNHWGWL